MPRASIRRTSSRPRSVRPPCSMPCADPPNAVSKKWDGEIMRTPASNTTSRLSRSSSSAWAPSIESRPAVSDGFGRPVGEERRQVAARPDQPEGAAGQRLDAPGQGGEVQHPGGQAAPGGGRPALGEGERDDVVGRVVVVLDVHALGGLRRHREDLQRHVAGLHPRDVHVPARRAADEVAAEQQRVGVEVGDPQRRVQRRASAPDGAGHGPGVTGFIRASARAAMPSSTGRATAAAPTAAVPAASVASPSCAGRPAARGRDQDRDGVARRRTGRPSRRSRAIQSPYLPM